MYVCVRVCVWGKEKRVKRQKVFNRIVLFRYFSFLFGISKDNPSKPEIPANRSSRHFPVLPLTPRPPFAISLSYALNYPTVNSLIFSTDTEILPHNHHKLCVRRWLFHSI